MSYLHATLVERVELVGIEPTKWGACKAVLRCIAHHANEQEADLSWPGVELMMLETGFSESVIVRSTGVLADHGWITKKRRYGTSNVYRINVAKLQAHQVARPAPRTVHMAEHIAEHLFPGENIADLLSDAPPVPGGRSTARERAAKVERSPEPVDNSTKPQVNTEHVKSTYSTERSNEHPSKTPSNTSNRRGRTRQIDVVEHVKSTTKPVENQKKNSTDRPARVDVQRVMNAIPPELSVGRSDRTELETLIASALDNGQPIDTVIAELGKSGKGARSAMPVLRKRLSELPAPLPAPASVHLEKCPEHSAAARRSDGECSGCWVEREGWADPKTVDPPSESAIDDAGVQSPKAG